MAERLTVDRSSDALILVDIQNDFCKGGALAVPDGEAVAPIANRLATRFDAVVLTQDWHPEGHHSFASTHDVSPFTTVKLSYGDQTAWPDHCIIGQPGSEFRADLDTTNADLVVRKGFRAEIDSYSAFYENDRSTPTGLAGYLRERGIQRLFFAGLATDFCVGFSALDARRLGFEAVVIEDACRAIDLEGSLATMKQQMAKAGVILAAANDLS